MAMVPCPHPCLQNRGGPCGVVFDIIYDGVNTVYSVNIEVHIYKIVHHYLNIRSLC